MSNHRDDRLLQPQISIPSTTHPLKKGSATGSPFNKHSYRPLIACWLFSLQTCTRGTDAQGSESASPSLLRPFTRTLKIHSSVHPFVRNITRPASSSLHFPFACLVAVSAFLVLHSPRPVRVPRTKPSLNTGAIGAFTTDQVSTNPHRAYDATTTPSADLFGLGLFPPLPTTLGFPAWCRPFP